MTKKILTILAMMLTAMTAVFLFGSFWYDLFHMLLAIHDTAYSFLYWAGMMCLSIILFAICAAVIAHLRLKLSDTSKNHM